MKCKHEMTEEWCADCQRVPVDKDEFVNWEDYWIGNEQPRPGWTPVHRFIRQMELEQAHEWTPERVAIEDLMAADKDRVGGITGLEDQYVPVKAGLIKLGKGI